MVDSLVAAEKSASLRKDCSSARDSVGDGANNTKRPAMRGASRTETLRGLSKGQENRGLVDRPLSLHLPQLPGVKGGSGIRQRGRLAQIDRRERQTQREHRLGRRRF